MLSSSVPDPRDQSHDKGQKDEEEGRQGGRREKKKKGREEAKRLWYLAVTKC